MSTPAEISQSSHACVIIIENATCRIQGKPVKEIREWWLLGYKRRSLQKKRGNEQESQTAANKKKKTEGWREKMLFTGRNNWLGE